MEKFYEEELRKFDTYEAANDYRHDVFIEYGILPIVISYRDNDGDMIHALRFNV